VRDRLQGDIGSVIIGAGSVAAVRTELSGDQASTLAGRPRLWGNTGERDPERSATGPAEPGEPGRTGLRVGQP